MWVKLASGKSKAACYGGWQAAFLLLFSLNVAAEAYDRVFDNTHALANSGNPQAQLRLGHSYYMGMNGAQRSCEQAIYWWQRASQTPQEMTSNIALYSLGQVYEDSSCPQHDYVQAAFWYQSAAARGISAAQNALGLLYLNGQGVARDSKQAFKWFEMAAKQENTAAAINLALLYLNGNGVNKSNKDAIFWMEKAARWGDVEAQARLAVLYAANNAETHDDVLAYMWSRIAALKTGDLKFTKQIEQKLSKNDADFAKKLVNDCIKSEYRECDYER